MKRLLLLDFFGGLDLWALSSSLSVLARLKGAKLKSTATKWGFRAQKLLLEKLTQPRREWSSSLRRFGLGKALRPEQKMLASIFSASYEAIRRPEVFVSPIPVPIGEVRFFPFPEELLGLPVRGVGHASPPDLLASSLLKAIGAKPALNIEGVAVSASVGAGEEETVCRAILLEPLEEQPAGDVVTVLEALVDDMPPEHIPPGVEALLQAGALDAFVRQVWGKKGRPAFEFVAISPPERASEVEAAMLRETTTIGLRRTYTLRTTVERKEQTVQTRFGPVRVKFSLLPDGSTRIKPEFQDCLELSQREGLPLYEVWLEALQTTRAKYGD